MATVKKVRSGNFGQKLATPNAIPSATVKAGVRAPRLRDVGSGDRAPHPTRDQDLVVFTNFWFSAVRYQILFGLSDNGLSGVLGVSDKTIPAWRDCIDAAGVIDDLLKLINSLPMLYRSANTSRVKQSLAARRHQLENPSMRVGKKGAGLPSIERFKEAVDHSKNNVLLNLVMNLDAKDSRTGVRASDESKALAAKVASDLVLCYRANEAVEQDHFRDDLLRELAELSKTVSHLSFLKANTILPGAHFLDSIFEADYMSLEDKRVRHVEACRMASRGYLGKLYRLIEAGESFSEATAFRAYLGPSPISKDVGENDPMSPANVQRAKDEHLGRMNKLIDFLARVYERLP